MITLKARLTGSPRWCKSADKSGLRIGVANLKPGGDEAFLCYYGQELIGCLAWYTSDGEEANVNAMGIFLPGQLGCCLNEVVPLSG